MAHVADLLQTGPLAVLIVTAWLALYVGRRSFHAGIKAVGRLIDRPLRTAARAARRTANNIDRRNRAVMTAHAREEASARIEREFQRIDDLVRCDLHEFPALQTRLLEHITSVEKDFEASGMISLPSPQWVAAVGEVLSMKADGDPMMENILGQTKDVVNKAQRQVVDTYRRAFRDRDRRLAQCRPQWRRLNETLHGIDRRLAGLDEGAGVIDAAMDRYERVIKGDRRLDWALAASSLVRLLVSSVVLVVAFGGALINYHLLSQPLVHILSAPYHILGLSTGKLMALVLVAAEIAMGMLTCDALRITKFFPPIAAAGARGRRRVLVGSLLVLVGFAGLEALLIVIREQTMVTVAPTGSPWQAAVGAILGLALPAVMVLVAIPLEVFVHALRAVMGIIVVSLVRGLSLTLLLITQVLASCVRIFSFGYDLAILPALVLERLFQQGSQIWATNRKRRQARL